jgi:hypothetical protein
MADDVVELMLDQLLENNSLDGPRPPGGRKTTIRASYDGLGRRSITLAMSLPSNSFAPPTTEGRAIGIAILPTPYVIRVIRRCDTRVSRIKRNLPSQV